ncbi:hypothetical protein, partial [Evtepia sp.]|uniref:hypothetical protein n=1 Tax=Evtepia sp. TaxID=2773933 RepID=UPI003F13CFAC
NATFLITLSLAGLFRQTERNGGSPLRFLSLYAILTVLYVWGNQKEVTARLPSERLLLLSTFKG